MKNSKMSYLRKYKYVIITNECIGNTIPLIFQFKIRFSGLDGMLN